MTDRKQGRPRSVMTPEVCEKIVETVRITGCWPETAARAQGIDPAAMRKHKERHPEFVTALESALGNAEIGFHGTVLRAANGSPAVILRDEKGKPILNEKGRATVLRSEIRPSVYAATWMLERRWPEHYARKEAPAIGEIHVAEGGKVEVAAGPPMPEPGEWGPYVAKLEEVTRSLDEAAAKRNGAPREATDET